MSKVAAKHFVLVAPLAFTGAGEFTYHSDQPLAAGRVVKVGLGRRDSLGVVVDSAETPQFATKPVEVLDMPPLPQHLVELARWLADYYAASPASVWQTILPTGLTKKRRSPKAPPVATLPPPKPAANRRTNPRS